LLFKNLNSILKHNRRIMEEIYKDEAIPLIYYAQNTQSSPIYPRKVTDFKELTINPEAMKFVQSIP